MSSTAFSWPNGKRCAVSLTYDDGLKCHPDHVAPLLESHGLRATFYVNLLSDIIERTGLWTSIAARGHELGNHTCFHPCRSEPGRELGWLDPAYNLVSYSPKRWTEEVKLASAFLTQVDGRTERTFGNTCHHLTLGQDPNKVALSTLMTGLFETARGPFNKRVITRENLNWLELGCYGADAKTLNDLKPELEAARELGGWIIYCIHGVGKGTHNMYIDDGEHKKLVEYLSGNSQDYWCIPVHEAAKHLKSK